MVCLSVCPKLSQKFQLNLYWGQAGVMYLYIVVWQLYMSTLTVQLFSLAQANLAEFYNFRNSYSRIVQFFLMDKKLRSKYFLFITNNE